MNYKLETDNLETIFAGRVTLIEPEKEFEVFNSSLDNKPILCPPLLIDAISEVFPQEVDNNLI